MVKISSIKHHLVMEDCNKLAPTNTVNHNQFWFTYIDKMMLINIKLPAIPLTILFFIMCHCEARLVRLGGSNLVLLFRLLFVFSKRCFVSFFFATDSTDFHRFLFVEICEICVKIYHYLLWFCLEILYFLI